MSSIFFPFFSGKYEKREVTEQQAAQLRSAVSTYCSDKLNATEACAQATLEEVRKCRQQFESANQK